MSRRIPALSISIGLIVASGAVAAQFGTLTEPLEIPAGPLSLIARVKAQASFTSHGSTNDSENQGSQVTRRNSTCKNMTGSVDTGGRPIYGDVTLIVIGGQPVTTSDRGCSQQ